MFATTKSHSILATICSNDPPLWATEDARFASLYLLHIPPEKRKPFDFQTQNSPQSPAPALSLSDRIFDVNDLCRKFNTGRVCPGKCKYIHRCSFDPTRCLGYHSASTCHLNPAKSNSQQNPKGTGSNAITFPSRRRESPPPRRRE